MKVHFWGTRGSLPATLTADAVRGKVLRAVLRARGREFADEAEAARFVDVELPFDIRGSYGCSTPCVEIAGGSERILCDAGSGIRDFGQGVMNSGGRPGVYNIFISHPHWDHIQGFPFFTPAYIPGNKVIIHGCHQELKKAFEMQQSAPFFPVPLAAMKGDITFNILEPGRVYDVAGVKVRAVKQNHPGGSFGYRFELGGKSVVYSTDAEHFKDALDDSYYFWGFADKADLLIYDAQYNFVDAVSVKENWGHSSNVLGVEQAVKAGAKKLCLFHNEHTCGDAELEKFLADTKEYLTICAPKSKMEIFLAYDGLELEV